MAKVTVKKNESIAKALRRFKRQCKKEGLIKEMRKRRCYIKPSERRRRSLLRTQRKNSRGN